MNIFHQLRWKLTLSYTLVTVSAFLVITIIMGTILFDRVLISDNPLSPAGLVQILKENETPLWSYILSQSPVDTKLIPMLAKGTNGAIMRENIFQIGNVQFSLYAVASFRALIIGADGILLGTTEPSFLPSCPVGETFCIDRVPGLEAPFRAAMAGETDPNRLYSSQGGVVNTSFGEANRFTLAVPILSQTEENKNQVLGVMVVIVDSLPTRNAIPAHVLDLAGRSLLIFLLGAGTMGAVFGGFSAHGLSARFERLSAAADLWSAGDFSTFVTDTRGDEISSLVLRLNNMARQLQGLLRRRQELAVAEERNRLARDLHDSAKQQALAASFELGTALALCDRDPGGAKTHLVQADALVDEVRKELTNLVHELRPISSDEQDVAEILKEYVLEWSHRSGIVLEMDIKESSILPIEAREALFRITQEALANVTRHSSAHHVTLLMEQGPGIVKLTIRDDGRGFDTGVQHNGLGLRSMRERAEALGGSFTMESAPGRGTEIVVTLPKEV